LSDPTKRPVRLVVPTEVAGGRPGDYESPVRTT